MALLDCSSCGDGWTVAPNTGGGTANIDFTQVQGPQGTFQTVAGRNGNGISLGSFEITFLQGPQANVCVGFAYKLVSFANSIVLLEQRPASLSIILQQTGDGRVYVQLNAHNSIFHNSPNSVFRFNLNQFYYIELLAQQTFAGGIVSVTYDVHVNENSILSGTLTATPGPATGYEGTFSDVAFESQDGCILDDLTITDGEFLGDVAISALFPRLDGDTIMWVPLVAGNHFVQVNEHNPDFDTTYVSSANVNDIDQYFLDLIIGFTGTIKGARLLLCVRKTDAGLASVQGVMKSGGGTTVLTGSDFYASDTNYIYAWYSFRKSVFTGLDWTSIEINAAQFGVKRTN